MTEPLRVETWHGKRIDAMSAHDLRRALRESCRAHFADVRDLRARLEALGHARIVEPSAPAGFVIDPALRVAHFRPVPENWLIWAFALWVIVAAIGLALMLRGAN